MSIPEPAPLDDHEYDAIEGAIVATSRGRRFLAEYARRNRQSDTTAVLAAIERLEDILRTAPAAEAPSTPAVRADGADLELADGVHPQLIELARAIARAKTEIAAIKPEPQAGASAGRLDTIVPAARQATGEIAAAAEHIRNVAWTMREQGLPNDICDALDANAAEIAAACALHDTTARRTETVIDALHALDHRLSAMIASTQRERAVRPAAATPVPAAPLPGPTPAIETTAKLDADLALDEPEESAINAFDRADEVLASVSSTFSGSVPRPLPPWLERDLVPAPDKAPSDGAESEDEALSIDKIVAATEELSVADSLATLPAIPLSIELRIEPARPAPDVTPLIDAFAGLPDSALLEAGDSVLGERTTPVPETPLIVRQSADDASRPPMPPAATLPTLTFTPDVPASAEALKVDAPEPDAPSPAANDSAPSPTHGPANYRFEPLAIISALSAEEKIALCS